MGGAGHHHANGSAPGTAGSGGAVAGVGDPRLGAHALTIRQSEVVFDIAADGKRTAYRFDNRNNYGATYGGTVNLSWAAPEMVRRDASRRRRQRRRTLFAVGRRKKADPARARAARRIGDVTRRHSRIRAQRRG
jgi:hypothetical protein